MLLGERDRPFNCIRLARGRKFAGSRQRARGLVGMQGNGRGSGSRPRSAPHPVACASALRPSPAPTRARSSDSRRKNVDVTTSANTSPTRPATRRRRCLLRWTVLRTPPRRSRNAAAGLSVQHSDWGQVSALQWSMATRLTARLDHWRCRYLLPAVKFVAGHLARCSLRRSITRRLAAFGCIVS